MSYVKPLGSFTAYGNGTLQGDATAGAVAQLVGSDTFALADENSVGVGVFRYDVNDETRKKDSGQPAVLMAGGLFETDLFAGNPQPGLYLYANHDGILFQDEREELPIGQTIKVEDGVLTYKLLV